MIDVWERKETRWSMVVKNVMIDVCKHESDDIWKHMGCMKTKAAYGRFWKAYDHDKNQS